MKTILNKIAILGLLLAAIGFTACDVITPPYLQNGGTVTDTTDKKILLEDYTGSKCGNCPKAHEIAQQIVEQYKGKVILLTIHAGPFAIPDNKDFKTDLRTPIGTELDKHFDIGPRLGNPNGMVDRGTYSGVQVLGKDEWDAAVIQRFQTTPILKLGLTPSYNSATREIKAKVNIKYLKPGGPSNYLAVYFVEDSVVTNQYDYRLGTNDLVLNYVNNAVLRGGLTGTWGDQLSSNDIPAGTEFTKEYSYTIPSDKTWRPEKMKIIAYIHDNGNTFEIYQAEEQPLIK